MIHIDKEKINLELARNQWGVEELCDRMEWQPARFYQMMRRGTAPTKAVGILANELGVSPEKIVQRKSQLKRKDG